MKWKGRRQSKNLEDKTGEVDMIATFIQRDNKDSESEGPTPTVIRTKNQKLPTKKIPVPTSAQEARDNYRGSTPKTDRIQVTPGKWKSNTNKFK